MTVDGDLVETPVVRRAAWGARAPRDVDRLAPGAIDELVFHYTGSLADELPGHAGCVARVRGIQAFHMDERGWNDIAYSWLFCLHGTAFEGRGWLVQTAATLNHNDHTQAACFLGADKVNRDDVTAAGRRAAAALFFGCRDAVGHGIRGVGHRDRVSTSCPGDEIQAWVRARGWLSDRPAVKPWPVPVPRAFWAWAKWRRDRWLYPSRIAWLRARPAGVPLRVPSWYWVRLAAMGGA